VVTVLDLFVHYVFFQFFRTNSRLHLLIRGIVSRSFEVGISGEKHKMIAINSVMFLNVVRSRKVYRRW